MRYNPTDRIGVNETERIFKSEFNWIFREQAIVNVGINALVEQSENRPSELKLIVEPIRKHAERALELIIGVQGYKIRFTKLDDSENYKSYFDYTKESGKEYINTNSNIEPKSLSYHETL